MRDTLDDAAKAAQRLVVSTTKSNRRLLGRWLARNHDAASGWEILKRCHRDTIATALIEEQQKGGDR